MQPRIRKKNYNDQKRKKTRETEATEVARMRTYVKLGGCNHLGFRYIQPRTCFFCILSHDHLVLFPSHYFFTYVPTFSSLAPVGMRLPYLCAAQCVGDPWKEMKKKKKTLQNTPTQKIRCSLPSSKFFFSTLSRTEQLCVYNIYARAWKDDTCFSIYS